MRRGKATYERIGVARKRRAITRARQQSPSVATPIPLGRPCARCKVTLGSTEGVQATFWVGAFKYRREAVGTVCNACVPEIRKTGPGGSLKMHGMAQPARVKASLNNRVSKAFSVRRVPLPDDTELEAAWGRWLAHHKDVGQGHNPEPAVISHGHRVYVCRDCSRRYTHIVKCICKEV